MLDDPRLMTSRHGTLGLLLCSKAEKTPELAVGPLFARSLSLCLRKLVKKLFGCRNVLALLGESRWSTSVMDYTAENSSLQHALVQHIVVTAPTTIVAYLTHWLEALTALGRTWS